MIYPDFYKTYISLLEDKPLLKVLTEMGEAAVSFYKNIDPEKWLFSYSEGKWTIKEVLGHVIDTERIMAYRALRFARKDKTSLPGFEHNDYIKNANYNRRQPDDLIDEFYLVRQSNILLFTGFSIVDMEATGIANDGEISVDALGYIISGHEFHHRKVIQDKYFPAFQ
jgi:hypothetical protein